MKNITKYLTTAAIAVTTAFVLITACGDTFGPIGPLPSAAKPATPNEIITPPDTTGTGTTPPDTTIVTPPPPDTTVTPPPPDTTIVTPPPPDTTVTPPPPDTTIVIPPPPDTTIVTPPPPDTTVTPPPPTGTNTGTPCILWYTSNFNATRYEIGGADQLAGLAMLVNEAETFVGKTVVLVNDIDLSVYGRGYNGGRGWIPIGRGQLISFFGVFDGNKKKITGLFIDDITLEYAGLFASVRGTRSTIRNLGLQDVNINGGEYVGGLAAFVGGGVGGRIENCYVTGTIIGTRTVGGLIAWLHYPNSLLTDSYSTANVTGTGSVGGLVGTSTVANIVGCYSTGEVRSTSTASNRTAGGLVGHGGGSSITRSAALNSNISTQSTGRGRITGNADAATLAGNVAFNGMTINTAITTGTATNHNGADITAATIRSDGTIGGLFTSANGWTTQNGRLPGLFGETVELPEHLR